MKNVRFATTLGLVMSLFANGCGEDKKEDTPLPLATASEVATLAQEALNLCETALNADSPCASEFFKWNSVDECTKELQQWDTKKPAECFIKIPDSAMDWSGFEEYCNDEKRAYYNCFKGNSCSSMALLQANCKTLAMAVDNCLDPHIEERLNSFCPKQNVDMNCDVNGYGGENCTYKCKGTWEECVVGGALKPRAYMMKCENDVLTKQQDCGVRITSCNDTYTDCKRDE